VRIGNTLVLDTFAEAFGMRYTGLIVTALDAYWLDGAVREFSGYSASVIACDAEIGVERYLAAEASPDQRPGAALLAFGFSPEALSKAVATRAGQCLMTCPTTAVFDAVPDSEHRLPLGQHLRFFGDGYQKSKLVDGVRYWRIPVMDGEFVVVESLGIRKGIAGGNLILQAVDLETALAAARRGVQAIDDVPGTITPFPAGVVRSGSKVGSRYKALKASTADAYCPTLRGRVESQLVDDANCAYEIVIDGISEDAVATAMKMAIQAAAGDGVLAIGAGNYGGRLGKHHFHLRRLLDT
jgi:formylmethanofuran--tetrahydromethanopterin N-formyltransferase